MKQTYEVHIRGDALRIMKVRAGSPREALDIAEERIVPSLHNTPWVIDFSGYESQHFDVWLGEECCDLSDETDEDGS